MNEVGIQNDLFRPHQKNPLSSAESSNILTAHCYEVLGIYDFEYELGSENFKLWFEIC